MTGLRQHVVLAPDDGSQGPLLRVTEDRLAAGAAYGVPTAPGRGRRRDRAGRGVAARVGRTARRWCPGTSRCCGAGHGTRARRGGRGRRRAGAAVLPAERRARGIPNDQGAPRGDGLAGPRPAGRPGVDGADRARGCPWTCRPGCSSLGGRRRWWSTRPGRTVEEPGLVLVWQLDWPPGPPGPTTDGGPADACGRVGGMPTSAADLLSAAYNDADRTIDLRRRLHRHPEIGLHLPQTQATVLDALRRPAGGGDAPGRRPARSSASCAGRGRARPTCCAADMDALPVHEDTGLALRLRDRPARCTPAATTPTWRCSMGAAEVLSKMKDKIKGTVVFIFQPAEEGRPPRGEEGGARGNDQGRRDGLAQDRRHFRHSYQFADRDKRHKIQTTASPNDGRQRPLVLDQGKRQKQTHVFPQPWSGIDPVAVAAQIINGLQMIVSREQSELTKAPVVITVGRDQRGRAARISFPRN